MSDKVQSCQSKYLGHLGTDLMVAFKWVWVGFLRLIFGNILILYFCYINAYFFKLIVKSNIENNRTLSFQQSVTENLRNSSDIHTWSSIKGWAIKKVPFWNHKDYSSFFEIFNNFSSYLTITSKFRTLYFPPDFRKATDFQRYLRLFQNDLLRFGIKQSVTE